MNLRMIMVDLDGTLVNTNEVNYLAYSEALSIYGFHMEREYYYRNCNGRHYLAFLPEITTYDKMVLEDIHERKKEAYQKYLGFAKLNQNLADLIRSCKGQYYTALVTTASSKNTYELLEYFGITDIFNLILTRDNVEKSKPDPQGYLLALDHFGVKPDEAIVFEDSTEGIQAARSAGCKCYQVME